jgi:lipopolysaccharide export system protein LptA
MIVLNQNTGDFEASGGVTSTRLPDKKTGAPSMLSQNEAIQGKAERLVSSEGGLVLHYEKGAVLWQGANRLQGDSIEIDRNSKRLSAQGNVVSRFLDQPPEKDKKPKTAAPVFTVIRAPTMLYIDQTRLAHYEGGAHLVRPGLNVKGAQIRAFLKGGDSGASIEKALADGQVNILQVAEGRTRQGSSEHAVYEVAEEKVTLTGGSPLLIDSVRGRTQGDQLTWYARDDRLLVNGLPGRPAVSRIIRK